MIYTPTPTLDRFHASTAIARFIIGPLGSGKSHGMIMELLRRACTQEPDEQGVRPTRFSITRNTLPQLKQTCLADTLQLFQRFGIVNYKVSDQTLHVRLNLPDGSTVESDWLLMPIEKPEDTRKLLSLQLTGAWLSEFRELNYGIGAAVLGRIGRYPSPARVAPTWQGVLGESNPFSEGSDWYNNLVMDLPPGWAFFKQPGGLDHNAENRKNLPADYYERLVHGQSEEWIKVHVHGQYGDDLSGQAVFGRAFSYEYHTADELLVNPQAPLIIAMDLGRTPTALLCQVDTRGRLLVFREITSVDMGLNQFLDEMLTPVLAQEEYRTVSRFVVADPAGRIKSQLSEESAFDVYNAHGYAAYPAVTNDVGPRLRAVESLLMQNRGDTAALLIDREGCPGLIRALRHEYKYKRLKTGKLEDKPEKLHPWSDLADALQYAALAVNSNLPGRVIRRSTPPPARPKVTARGWT